MEYLSPDIGKILNSTNTSVLVRQEEQLLQLYYDTSYWETCYTISKDIIDFDYKENNLNIWNKWKVISDKVLFGRKRNLMILDFIWKRFYC